MQLATGPAVGRNARIALSARLCAGWRGDHYGEGVDRASLFSYAPISYPVPWGRKTPSKSLITEDPRLIPPSIAGEVDLRW